MAKKIFVFITVMFVGKLFAQSDSLKRAISQIDQTNQKQKEWYENIQIRGYVQTRYNRLLETNPDLKCEQCDKSESKQIAARPGGRPK